jgi:hypothetical protein
MWETFCKQPRGGILDICMYCVIVVCMYCTEILAFSLLLYIFRIVYETDRLFGSMFGCSNCL